MCLAMVYTDEVKLENLVLSNVQRIDCRDGVVVLTDLMEREVTVKGRLLTVDLVGNTAVIETAGV